MPLQLFALSGTYEGYDEETNTLSYNSTSLFNIAYNASEASNVYPRYYMGMKLSLSNYILRSVFKFKAKKDSEDFIYVMVDSIRAEVGDKAAYLFPGVTESGQNLQGGAKNTTNASGWRFLFNKEAGGGDLVVGGDLIALPAGGVLEGDLRHTGALKGVAADGRNAGRNGDLGQVLASVEAEAGDHRQLRAGGKGDLSQAGAAVEYAALQCQHIVTACAVF